MSTHNIYFLDTKKDSFKEKDKKEITKITELVIKKTRKKIEFDLVHIFFFLQDDINLYTSGERITKNTAIVPVSRRVDLKKIKEVVAHELNHLIRAGVFGYGETLADSVILEGLAIHFAEAFACTNEELNYFVMEKEKDSFDFFKQNYKNKNFFYKEIMFGGTDIFKPYFGYRLGYYAVGRYLKQTQKSIFEATKDTTEHIMQKSDVFS